jgi:hypothetical protein
MNKYELYVNDKYKGIVTEDEYGNMIFPSNFTQDVGFARLKLIEEKECEK